MKYFDQLNKLESCLIELDKAKALSNAVVAYFEAHYPADDAIPLMYLLNDLLEKGLSDTNEAFQETWNALRDDEQSDDFEPVKASINIHPPLWDEHDFPYAYDPTK